VSSAETGLMVLVGTIVVAGVGAWDLLAAGAARDELHERATGERLQPRAARLAHQITMGFERTPPGHRLQLHLDAAAVSLTALQAVLIALVAGIAAYLAASTLVGHTASAVAGLLAIFGLWMSLEHKREARRNAFMAQLPDLARILSNGASAGLSMVSAYGIAVEELEDPAKTELQITLEEIKIGQPFDRAMENLSERMPSRELGVLVSTLAIQQRSGGDLVRALSDMASTLEARRETQREVKTLMAGATASSYVVMVIGCGSLFLADITQPGTLDRVAASPIGLFALFVAFCLFALGWFLIRRITRIET
jgi:tight adherence protein B